MPKVTLTFKIPEETEELKLAQDGPRLSSILNEFRHYLRAQLKYENLNDEQYATIERVQKKLFEIISDYDL